MLLAYFRIMFAESKDQIVCLNSSLSIPVGWRLHWNHIDNISVGEETTLLLHTLILSASQACRSFLSTEISSSEALKNFSYLHKLCRQHLEKQEFVIFIAQLTPQNRFYTTWWPSFLLITGIFFSRQ